MCIIALCLTSHTVANIGEYLFLVEESQFRLAELAGYTPISVVSWVIY